MTKKLCKRITVTASAIALLVVPTQANMASNTLRSAPYIGAAIGLSHMSGTMKFANTPTIGGNVVNLPLNLSANSIDGSVFFGYGHKMGCYWLAGEFGYTFDSLKSNSNVTVISAVNTKSLSVKSSGALEAAVHIGWVPYPSIALYAILGVENRRFRASFQDNVINPNPDIAASINKSYSSTAFVPGIGTLVKITKDLALKAEYKAALHRSKTFTASKNNVGGVVDNISMKVSPIVHTVKVGLVYSF